MIQNHLKTGLFTKRPGSDGAGRDTCISQVPRDRHPTQFNLRGEIKGKCISSLIWEGHRANSQNSELREPGLRRGGLPDTKLLLSPWVTHHPSLRFSLVSSQRQACSTQYRRWLREVLTLGPYSKRTSFYAPFTNFK